MSGYSRARRVVCIREQGTVYESRERRRWMRWSIKILRKSLQSILSQFSRRKNYRDIEGTWEEAF
jgi:hypothetical protein